MKMNIGNVESGNLIVKVIAANNTSMTLTDSDKFQGKVIQPGHKSFATIGEHGLAMSIKILEDDTTHLFLFDTAGFMQTITNNFKQFKIKLSDIEKIIISHGHLDHYGGLIPIIPELKEGCEIYLSPICFEKSYYAFTESGEEIPSEDFGTSLKDLKKEGKIKYYRRSPINRNIVYNRAIENNVKIIETTKPEKLCEGIILSGKIQIFDETELPKGLYLAKNKMEYEKHTYREEIALYINVKDKGLVIITGCSHTGIINIIKHGQNITGIDKIYALIGGFHKECDASEDIEEIVSFIEDLNPEITCGMHCTGFEFNRLMSRHPSHAIGVIGTEFYL